MGNLICLICVLTDIAGNNEIKFENRILKLLFLEIVALYSLYNLLVHLMLTGPRYKSRGEVTAVSDLRPVQVHPVK